jgi:hypothetical protein
MHEYNLRVGNAIISLGFRRECHKEAFIEYFHRPSHPGPADIRLTIKFLDRITGLSEIPNSLFLTKKGDGRGFSVADGLITGKFSPKSGEGELKVQSIIMEGNFARIFEQILYQAYWSVLRRKGLDSLLLHSSGVIRAGKGYIFTGRSGTGKSTITTLSEGAKVLNDEITLIDFSGSRVVVSDTPFNGFFPNKVEGSAPLRALMLLKQAKRHRLTRIASADSIKTLSKEIIPPMGLETPLSPTVYWDMLGYAKKISDSVPVFLMEFLPDSGFWNLIEQEERNIDGGK